MQQTTGNDRLCFYSKSRDVPPGTGAGGEFVRDPAAYDALRSMPHWRRSLSNFDVDAPFEYDGLTYNSIEHAFQARKIRLVDPERARHFSLESGHEIGRGDGSVAQKHRKYVMLSKETIAAWNEMSNRVMVDVSKAKYCAPANERSRRVLLATGNAELLHISRGKPPVRFVHLEEIREQIFSRIV